VVNQKNDIGIEVPSKETLLVGGGPSVRVSSKVERGTSIQETLAEKSFASILLGVTGSSEESKSGEREDLSRVKNRQRGHHKKRALGGMRVAVGLRKRGIDKSRERRRIKRKSTAPSVQPIFT